MPMEKLLDEGKAEEAWLAIQALPGRVRFHDRYMRLRLRCAEALGWDRRALMIQNTLERTRPQVEEGIPR